MSFKFPGCSPLASSLQDLVLNSPAQWRRPSSLRKSDGSDSGFESPLPPAGGSAPNLFVAPSQPQPNSSRRCLFGGGGGEEIKSTPSKAKRSSNDAGSNASKRLRRGPMFLSPQLGKENWRSNPLMERVKRAVDKLEDGQNLIGDGSQTHVLPTSADKHQDLKCISPATMSALLDGDFRDVIASFRIIDCRYPYEYEAGHIKNAENVFTETDTEALLKNPRHHGPGRHVVIFHCEFSSNRAPRMLRHLRGLDRKVNADCYPFLFFPEMYLLTGGYKAFHAHAAETHCDPTGYKPMHHEAHAADLRHFRVKSKSWTAGDSRGARARRSLLAESPSFN